MAQVLVYCNSERLRRELEDGLALRGYRFDIFQESGDFMNGALEEKPDVPALCFSSSDQWAEAGIAALRKLPAAVKAAFLPRVNEEAER